jgi:hypothetical protein
MHAKTKQQGTAGRWWLVTQVSSCQVACKDIPHVQFCPPPPTHTHQCQLSRAFSRHSRHVQFYHPFLPHPPPPSTTHLYR